MSLMVYLLCCFFRYIDSQSLEGSMSLNRSLGIEVCFNSSLSCSYGNGGALQVLRGLKKVREFENAIVLLTNYVIALGSGWTRLELSRVLL